MTCPGCGTPQTPDAAFCDHCGRRLEAACLGCGAGNRPEARFCRRCGRRLAAAATPAPTTYTPRHLAERILTSRGALEGERKQVTVLFADIKGSMELLADRDPEEARRILDPVLERMMEAVHHYEGTVNQVMGDGIMALFGAPLAHEDHAVRACFAALRMRDTLRGLSAEVQQAGGAAIRVRIGVNSGEVVVRAIGTDLDVDYTAVGQSTHLAARMEQMAEPGTILISAATAALVEGYLEVVPRGPVAVKGLEHPVEAFEVVGAGAVRSRLQLAAARGLTPLVDRERELARLRAAWERTRAGHGQAVAVVGAAGVGKSRLLHEFVRAEAGGALVLAGAPVSYEQAVAWGAITDLLRTYLGLETGDDAAIIAGKAAARLRALAPALEDAVPAILALLEALPADHTFLTLDPPQRRARIQEALRRVLLEESRRQPVVVLVDNLHWLDSESRAFLDQLADVLTGARLLLLAGSRPDPAPGWRGAHATEVALDPLPAASAEALLDLLLGDGEAMGPVKRLLVERTGGNPLYLEESVRALVETGILAGARGGYRVARPLAGVVLPPTVQALLAARIDRLSPDDKRLLQSAAVIGHDVSYPLLRTLMGGSEDDLRAGLARLEAAEFLREARLFPDLEYRFPHALTHEVAYAGLLASRRRALHARITELLEAGAGDRLIEHVERLAHHARHGEQWERAVRYARRAAAKAMARSANAEAVVFLEQALGALAHLPETDDALREAVDLRLDLRPPLLRLGRLEEVLARSEEAEALAQRLGDTTRLARVYTYLINYHYLRGEPERALQHGERCLALAAKSGDEALELLAARYVGQIQHALGRYDRAREVLAYVCDRLGARAGDAERGAQAGVDHVASAGWLAFTAAEQGDFPAAQEAVERARHVAEAEPNPYAQAIAGTMAGLVLLRRGEGAQAGQVLRASLALCEERDLAVWRPIPSSLLGLALARQGRQEDGLRLLEAGVTLTERLGVRAYLALWTLHLAEGFLLAGDLPSARGAARRALDLAREHHERGHEASTHRLLGEIARQGAPAEAEAEFGQALELGAALGMRPLQAQCRLALSHLRLVAGDQPRAVEHLTGAIALFGDMQMRDPLRAARQELGPLGRLFIVSRARTPLYEFLRSTFQEDSSVSVILDRRQGERRPAAAAVPGEDRRRSERQAAVDESLREQGLAIVA